MAFGPIVVIHCGLPQGGCLGPLLFPVSTKDLPCVLKQSSVVMYADDSTMFYSDSNIGEMWKVLENNMDLLQKWVDENKIRSMFIGCKQWLHGYSQFCWEQVKLMILLGVTVNHHLSCSHHVDNIIHKIGKGVPVVRRCSLLLFHQFYNL